MNKLLFKRIGIIVKSSAESDAKSFIEGILKNLGVSAIDCDSESKGNFDLLISNSHAEDTAKRLGAPLYQMGFPVYKVLGNSHKVTIGYRGTLGLINDIANLFLEVHK